MTAALTAALTADLTADVTGAFLRRHDQLPALFDEMLSRRVGKYRNPLAERHLELDDPEVDAEASALALRLNGILKDPRAVQLPHMVGAEIPVKAMLHGIGLRTVLLPGAEIRAESREP